MEIVLVVSLAGVALLIPRFVKSLRGDEIAYFEHPSRMTGEELKKHYNRR